MIAKPAVAPSPCLGARGPCALRFEGGAVRLGGRTIWQGVTLEVERGELVAVLGPNGAGKSTLFRAALGLLPLAAGTVEALGEPVRRGNPRIGYLPQRRGFDAGLRIRGRDVVGLGLDGHRWGIPLPGRLSASRRAQQARVDEVIDLVGAGDYADRVVGELSGGEQQRLLIAQALVGRPGLLLLDEPLDSLDLTNQQAVSGLARRIARDEGVTVMLVAHDVNPILAHLDRVLYVAGGRAMIGRPEEIITSETLSALYGSPVEVLRTSDGRLFVAGQPEAVSYHSHATG
jgi:zinc/manganese transport system ATP-binding protein